MPLSSAALVLLVALPAAEPLPAPGAALRRSLDGKGVHRYEIELAKDSAASLRVDQAGIDVVVEVRGPDDTLLLSVDAPTGATGPEAAEWVSDDGGRFTIVVRPYLADAPRGEYVLTVSPTRTATARDRDLMWARRDLSLGYERRQAFDYGAARDAGERALAAMRRADGPRGLATADACDLLGYVYDEIGLYDRGAEMFATALSIRSESASVPASVVNETESNLAWLELAAGRYAEAEQRFRAVAERRLKAADGEVDRAPNALAGRSAALRHLGRSTEAAAVAKDALDRTEKNLGPNANALDHLLRHYALALVDGGRAVEGEAACRRALALPRSNRWDEMGRGYDLRCVGSALAAQGRYAEAEPLFAEALQICGTQRGADSLCAADVREDQGRAALRSGDEVTARVRFDEALRIRAAVLPPSHPDVVSLRQAQKPPSR
jgi:tetratricopeptide (TPR) repeat protein